MSDASLRAQIDSDKAQKKSTREYEILSNHMVWIQMLTLVVLKAMLNFVIKLLRKSIVMRDIIIFQT